ncbi:MAG: hypothetical protein K2P57_05320 [Burkholderiales bacterium]|nr:hypothetical protein [Burkholderiales bacterium]
MKIDKFLLEATRAGITFEVEGDKLTVEGPGEALDRFLPAIKSRKQEILDYLGPDPMDGILDAIAEYDSLINRLCDLKHHSQEHRDNLLKARRSMAPADLTGDLDQFKRIVEDAEGKSRREAA